MDRKEFLITLWRKGIKPALFIVVIYFCIKYLINLFTENGPERFLTIGIIGIMVFYTLIYLLGSLFKKATDYLFSQLSDSLKFWVRVTNKMIDFITPILFGVLIYHFWKEDRLYFAGFLTVVLINRLREIITEEKQATTTHTKKPG